MEYQNVITLLNNTPNQPSQFRTQNWVEINDDARVTLIPIFKSNLRLQC